MIRFVLQTATAGVLLHVTAFAAAQDFPQRPLRLVVPTGAGGVTDILARFIAPRLAESLGQPVVIDNRPGASGVIGSQLVAAAPADGHTLVMVFPSHAVNPSLFKSLPYDTVKSFAPVTLVSTVSTVLIVGSDSPVKTTQEMIALAKAKPGTLNYGSVGSGSLGHLGAKLMRSMARLQITHVPYKASPQVLTALVSGEIQLYFIASAGTVVPQEKAGRVRALGVSTRHRLPILPHVPPIADALPGYEATAWNGILAPAGTPKTVIERLHREIAKIVRSPEFSQQLTGEGATAVGNTPAEFAALIQADIRKWAEVVKDAGIQRE